MPTLDEILAHKRLEVEALKARQKRTGSTTVMRAMSHVRPFADVIDDDALTLVPEIKKADPWRGIFRDDYDAVKLAQDLESAGARALAVQIDSRYFQGSADELYSVSRRTKAPVVARDFVVDDCQLTEIKARGGDVAVLTAGLVEPERLAAFVKFSEYILLQTLVECANEAEVEAAVAAGAQMIGVQNRDLRSQEVMLERSPTLRDRIPDEVIAVAVGGVTKAEDLGPLRDAGYDAVILGEVLMRAADPAAAYSELAAAVS